MPPSTSQASPGKRLRGLIEAPEILVLHGVFDGFSTRLVSRAGYPAAFITGSGVSESRLGQPDVGIMGLEENVAAARAIAACSDLLLLADGDTYQVNYTFRMEGYFEGDARALFGDLVSAHRSRYGALLRFGNRSVCSASPKN